MSLTNASKESKFFESIYPSGYNPYKIKWFDFLIVSAITLIVLICYIITQAPSVVAGDSGELTTEIYNMGALHPSGYPLYGILGKLFTFIPLGDIAYRVNLYVSISGAFAIFLFYFILVKLLGLNRDKGNLSLGIHLPAILASFVFAFSLDFWGQSSGSGKFYPLNVLLVAAFIFIMILWYEEIIYYRNEGRLHFAQRMTILLGFMMGLSLTVHQLPMWFTVAYILILLPSAMMIVISDRSENFVIELKKRGMIIFLFALAAIISIILFFKYAYFNRVLFPPDVPYVLTAIFLVPVFLTAYIIIIKLSKQEENWVDSFFETFMFGLWMFIFAMTLYLYLMVRARALAPLLDPKVQNWGDTQTLDILFNHMMRKQYGVPNYDYNNFLGQVNAVFAVTVNQFYWLNMLVAAAGIIYLFIKEKIWGLFTIGAVVISYLMLIKYINFDIDPRTISIQKQYFLQIHMIIALFIGFGYQLLLDLYPILFRKKKEVL